MEARALEFSISTIRPDGSELRPVIQEGGKLPRWSTVGLWIYFTKEWLSEDPSIWKVSSSGGRPVRVLDHAIYPLEFGEHLYFQRQGAIWRRPRAGGPETEILSIPENKTACGWEVTDKGIYYVDWNVDPPEFRLYEWETKQRTLLEAAVAFPAGPISVSPDGQWLLYDVSEFTLDIMLVENFR
jgi:hypothetical protein